MKYSIVYSSNTGNTALLAETIKNILPKEHCSYFGKMDADNTNGADAELVIAGFWTDKGSCDESMAAFLMSLHNKRVFLFGTAGFGKSSDYFERILSRVQENLDDTNTVTGSYMCQGRMPRSVRSRYESMLSKQPEKMQKLIENFDEACSHPDTADLTKLEEIVRNIAQ